ncbi:MAG: S9 family peptidase, partial [Anaerolineae bacterium]|nr:S9 family peptidase [Anaerolineae bacterium]
MPTFKIESLLAARLFVSPRLAGDRIYFLSDLSGRISLYAMDRAGSVPEPLLPPDIALQNPALMNGESFYVFPKLGKILVMIDQDGDENYQLNLIPLDGGLPEAVLVERFKGKQVNVLHCDAERNLVALFVDPRTSPLNESYLLNLETMELTDLGVSLYGNYYTGANADYTRIILVDSYTAADHAVYLWEKDVGRRKLLYGKPLDERKPGETVPLNAIGACHFTPGDKGLLLITALFDDAYGLGYLPLTGDPRVRPVDVVGAVHRGQGELYGLEHLAGDRYLLTYNIDGCSYAYEGAFDEAVLRFQVDTVICGAGVLSNGVLQ